MTRTDSNAGPVSEVILQHVKVLAIDQTSSEHQESPKVAKLVTIEVSQEQALKVLLAVNVGKLSLILRQASEVAVAPQSRVTASDLYTGETPPPVAPPPVEKPELLPVAQRRMSPSSITRRDRSSCSAPFAERASDAARAMCGQ